MTFGRMLAMLALGLASALAAFVPAATTGTSAAAVEGVLRVSSLAFGDRSFAAISLASSDPVAAVKLSIPAGYTVDLDEPTGTTVGDLSATLYAADGSSPAFVDGALVVDDPAKYTSDPAAQACAPGAHAAVWLADMSVLGQPFDLPIFIDPGGSTDSGSSAVTLRLCPAWIAPTLPGGVTAQQLTIFLFDVVTPPTSPGRYTWSAFVAPPIAGAVTADPTRAFEVRSVFPLPHTLTLQARHDPKAKSVVLTGRLTAVGEPEPGVDVSFGALTDSASDSTSFGPVKTNDAGEFTITRPVVRSTQFIASADTVPGPCTTPSSAPAGCVAETVAPAPSASTIVKVREATDPKLVVRTRDQALARRINLRQSDFPVGWESFETLPVFSCPGFKPKLTDLTVNGDLESLTFGTEEAVASSRASIYLSEAQAQTAFERQARLAAARCFADLLRADGATVLQLRKISFPPLGSATRAFRVVASDREDVVTVDLITFRRGRAVVQLGFVSLVQPLPIAHELAAKVAARARGA